MRAPPIIWDAAGRPDPRRKTAVARGVCWWCATTIDGPSCTVADTIPDTFTDYDRAIVGSSPLLCCEAIYSCEGEALDPGTYRRECPDVIVEMVDGAYRIVDGFHRVAGMAAWCTEEGADAADVTIRVIDATALPDLIAIAAAPGPDQAAAIAAIEESIP